MHSRIEERVLLEARLVADQLERDHTAGRRRAASRQRPSGSRRIVQARVTFIAADGRVLGDSWVNRNRLTTLEEHSHRPEIVEARRHGVGRARRVSATVDTEMLYTALPVRHADVAFVRLAVPAADVQQQLATVTPLTLLAAALGGCVALAFAWAFSIPLARRVASIAHAADRYAAGDFTRPPVDYGGTSSGAWRARSMAWCSSSARA